MTDFCHTDLQSIFAGSFEEDAGEKLCAGLHLKPLLDLFTLACEAGKRFWTKYSEADGIPDHPRGDIDEASNKETGGWRLPRRIVAHLSHNFEVTIPDFRFAHLCVHLVNPHKIAALPIDALRDSTVVVETLNRARSDAILAEVVRVQVILGCHLGNGIVGFHIQR